MTIYNSVFSSQIVSNCQKPKARNNLYLFSGGKEENIIMIVAFYLHYCALRYNPVGNYMSRRRHYNVLLYI